MERLAGFSGMGVHYTSIAMTQELLAAPADAEIVTAITDTNFFWRRCAGADRRSIRQN